MGRYRPPKKNGSPYITKEGAIRLKTELDELWRVERPKVAANVQAAAANGDRSENGDYIYGKRRLHEIDRRVRYLRKRLDEVKVVSSPPNDRNRVYLGAYVTLKNDAGDAVTWQLVGSDEFDLRTNKLSCDSPLGQALRGKSVDSKVTYKSPSGPQSWLITKVRYATSF